LVGAALATFGVTHKPPVLNHAEGGFAIGVLDRARVTGAMRVFGESDGLPPLPAHNLFVAHAPGPPGKAHALLAQTIVRHFRL